MGDHSNCGKKQYKSALCKAKSIAKSVEKSGTASPFQEPYVRWLNKQRG